MAILVRSFIKGLLFFVLFLLALKFVHTYPMPMTDEQVAWWLAMSRRLGIRDPDDLWMPATLIVDLIVTVSIYIGITRLWKTLRAKHRSNRQD
jgi:hypothetical protein